MKSVRMDCLGFRSRRSSNPTRDLDAERGRSPPSSIGTGWRSGKGTRLAGKFSKPRIRVPDFEPSAGFDHGPCLTDPARVGDRSPIPWSANHQPNLFLGNLFLGTGPKALLGDRSGSWRSLIRSARADADPWTKSDHFDGLPRFFPQNDANLGNRSQLRRRTMEDR
jgi:hypothetical protein